MLEIVLDSEFNIWVLVQRRTLELGWFELCLSWKHSKKNYQVQSPEEDNAFQLPSTQEVYHLPLSNFYEHFLASEPASASQPIAHKPASVGSRRDGANTSFTSMRGLNQIQLQSGDAAAEKPQGVQLSS